VVRESGWLEERWLDDGQPVAATLLVGWWTRAGSNLVVFSDCATGVTGRRLFAQAVVMSGVLR